MELIQTLNKISSVDQKSSGLEYLKSLAVNMANEMNVQYALIGRPSDSSNTRVMTDVAVSGGEIIPNFEYELEGTPCLDVLTGKRVCIHKRDAAILFPADILLTEMGVESYIGAPILNNEGNLVGLVVLLDTKPIKDSTELKTVCEFFASRISGEFFRMEGESRLLSINNELESIIEERTNELEQLTKRLKEDNQSLENALDKNQKLMATIFHDISNPLTVASLEANRINSGNGKEQSSKNIEYSINQVVKIINNLKSIFSGEKNSSMVSISLKEITKYSNFIFENKLVEKNIKLNLENDSILVKVDETTFLNSVFNNFISNAIKFSPAGGKISISGKVDSNRVTIEIQDEGIGISDDVIDSLRNNKPVCSSLGTDGEVGTGLGLGLTKNYLSKMNGSFEIFKNEIGTLVQVHLDKG
jgi:signal transduction histidine kinase